MNLKMKTELNEKQCQRSNIYTYIDNGSIYRGLIYKKNVSGYQVGFRCFQSEP